MSSSNSSLDASFVLVDDGLTSSNAETSTSSSRSYPSTAHSSSFANDWSTETTGGLRISGRHLVDKYGRVCIPRGVNLSGACKTPAENDYAAFFDKHERVTFVGRPFPLEEAPEHFARLKRWGLTFIRFLVTWEAIEHEGPGIYDFEYLDYLKAIISLLPEYGMTAFVSMHQDVWSRYTGGSGAPAWTVTAVGFDINKLEDAGAAWLKGVLGGGHVEAERGLWPCGYHKLASATMFTCFWGGDTFAPKLMIGEMSVQRYLQSAFLKAWEVLARTVGQLEAVVGFQMLNEPHPGYITLPSMHGFDYNTNLHLAHVPTAIQSFALGAGHSMLVPHWTRSFPMPTKLTAHEMLNEKEVNVWRPDGPTQGQCLWERHGVWGWDKAKKEAVVLRESYFVKNPKTGEKIDWYTDFYYPFHLKWAEIVRSVSSPDKVIFAEAIPNEFCPSHWTTERRPPNMVYAPHWYDLNALFNKAFGDFSVNVQALSRGTFFLKTFYWGQKGARENYSLQICNIVEASYKGLGENPVIIGECGIPMDMNRGEAFHSDNWTWQARMMDALIGGLERSLIGFTLWNYNPDNDDTNGDHWNGENFSWFSRSRSRKVSEATANYSRNAAALDEGGQILQAVVRPYPAKIAGIPIRFEYEMNSGCFEFEWITPSSAAYLEELSPSPSVNRPPTRVNTHVLKSNETQIFVPAMLTHSRKLIVTGLGEGDDYKHDEENQTLYVLTKNNGPGARHRMTVSLYPPIKPTFVVNDFWGDFRLHILSIIAFLIALIAYFLVL